jgi:uncharacterized protein YoxC
MSDTLDRLEKIVESNAKAILALTNQGIEVNAKIDRINTELNEKIDRTNSIVTELANIVLRIANRQDDQEDRITRLGQ